MIYSMTGYGRSEVAIGDYNIQIELKSINGKNAEVSLRLPHQLKPFDIPFRKKLIDKLQRGSIDLYINIKENGSTKPMSFNKDLLEKYYHAMSEVAGDIGVDTEKMLPSLLQLPEVVTPNLDVWDEDKVEQINTALDDAVTKLIDYRKTEGDTLLLDLEKYIQNIRELSESIAPHEEERKTTIKNRLVKNIEEVTSSVDFDRNRLEQELLYYLEKIDISEEKQRLASHLDYFDTILQDDSGLKGKKLNFITQEIGRELNTLGAKSYNSEMQKLVIQMKDQLEKIKEQILNVL